MNGPCYLPALVERIECGDRIRAKVKELIDDRQMNVTLAADFLNVIVENLKRAYKEATGRPLSLGSTISIATKNQPSSQGGWGGCDSLMAPGALPD